MWRPFCLGTHNLFSSLSRTQTFSSQSSRTSKQKSGTRLQTKPTVSHMTEEGRRTEPHSTCQVQHLVATKHVRERTLDGHLELIGHSLPSQHLPVTSQNKSLSKIDGTPCALNCWGMTVDTKPRLWLLLCGHFYSDQPFPILAGAF